MARTPHRLGRFKALRRLITLEYLARVTKPAFQNPVPTAQTLVQQADTRSPGILLQTRGWPTWFEKDEINCPKRSIVC